MRVVKDKAAMETILAADNEGIKNIALSGSAYETVEKTATDVFLKYIDKIIADKMTAEKLKNNKKMMAEITDMVQTSSEADDTTVDSIVARYKNKR
jgi:DNA-binding ferritin-like protein